MKRIFAILMATIILQSVSFGQTKSGVIKVKKTDHGIVEAFNSESNTLYRGITNPLKINYTIKPESLFIEASDGEAVTDGKTHVIKPGKMDSINISVYKMVSFTEKIFIGGATFQVRDLVKPFVVIDGIKGGEISQKELAETKTVDLSTGDCDYKFLGSDFEIISFTLVIENQSTMFELDYFRNILFLIIFKSFKNKHMKKLILIPLFCLLGIFAFSQTTSKSSSGHSSGKSKCPYGFRMIYAIGSSEGLSTLHDQNTGNGINFGVYFPIIEASKNVNLFGGAEYYFFRTEQAKEKFNLFGLTANFVSRDLFDNPKARLFLRAGGGYGGMYSPTNNPANGFLYGGELALYVIYTSFCFGFNSFNSFDADLNTMGTNKRVFNFLMFRITVPIDSYCN